MSGSAGQIESALTLLAQGLSRCVTVQDDGLYGMGWDSHSSNSHQDSHFQFFFDLVNNAMASMSTMTSISGNPLSEEVTVVLISEMGRDPRLNAQQGKHHWTHTSAMIVGAGVDGGQVVGAFNEDVASSPVNLATGEVDSGGTYLFPAHLGATLLALGDVDPEPYLGDAQPIEAVIK
jgi:uncharacterized protein (DUF1501 family)